MSATTTVLEEPKPEPGGDQLRGAEAAVFPEEPQVEIEVDLAAIEEYGLKPGDVRRQATTLLSGIQVGNLFEEQKVFDVVVWGAPELRGNLSEIGDLLIDTPLGFQVPLSEVAEVRIAPAATVIERDAVSRFVDVNANVSGRSMDAVTADVESSLQGINVPFEYHMEVVSNAQGVQANQQRLAAIVIAALLGIYLLMQAAFSSWRLAFFVFITSPMALAGGVLAVLLSGGVLSIGSIFGFFGILAIAVRSGMLLVNQLRQLGPFEDKSEGAELVAGGARERLTPILTTAVVTTLALLPLLFGGNLAGSEIIRPMAVVIVGGLVTAVLHNLFVVPALYLRWPSPIQAAADSEVEAQPSAAPEAA